MTEQTTTAALTGADAELLRILDRDEVLVCTRVWEAWRYKTMREDDFVPYTENAEDTDSGVAEILQWRDAAVQQSRADLADALRQALTDLDLLREWDGCPAQVLKVTADLRRALED